ncbi:hypothetical protein POM88_016653 [Heracleum sosnowskyi]|uniref:Transposase n=1 Tax=Heracleum sosnowskyi TaxID=360622 RepID=A0AAD8IMM8_9APIA|nr:hypothetical protein POM88_016653 [Heracleum sosnowskyi]
MASGSKFVMGWLYCDGNIVNNSVIGSMYDKDPIRFVKLLFNLNFRGLLDLLYAKLFIDPNLYKLRVLRRVMNSTTNKFGIAPIVDDDDVDYLFESLDGLGSKTHVELYVEKIPIGLSESSNDMVQCSKIGESSENTSTSHNSRSVQFSENISSDSSSRSLYMNRVDGEGNSRGSSEFRDDDIPYYRSFDGSLMVISYQEPVMQNVGDLHSPAELRKGMVFETKEELLEAVKRVHISNHQEFEVVRSDVLTWYVECKLTSTGCPWRMRARKRTTHNFFEIMDTNGPHNCLNQLISQDHRNLNCSNIAEIITSLIAADPSVSDKVLLSTILKEYGYTPSKKKLRDARRIATNSVYGSWEQSYQKLPLFLNALQRSNPGTYVDWYFKEHDLGQPISEVVKFKRVFWTFHPCIDAFAHCIPVLQIDGTHLYAKYKGVLLTATTVDGFYHFLPVAFAIVEGENIGSWTWFMERVRRIVAPNRTWVCVISDRHA